jgi:hypothetical protein
MAGIIAYPMATPEMGDLLLGTEIKEEGSAHLTKNFAIDAIRVLFAANTPIQFEEVLVAADAASTQLVSNGAEQLVTIGPAQVNVNNPVSLSSTGIITFNDAGLYTIKAIANFGTSTETATPAILLIAGFYNDVQYTETYSALVQYNNAPNTQSYNITKTFEAGDTFDFRIGKSAEGAVGDGGLFSFGGTNPFPNIPNFSIVIEQIKLV